MLSSLVGLCKPAYCKSNNNGRIIHSNNTLQAYPAVRRSDAQTGGLLLSGACYAI